MPFVGSNPAPSTRREFLNKEDQDMAQMCDLCGKKPASGNNVSHSNRKTRRRFEINLQNKSLVFGGKSVRLRVCTGCIRTYTKKMLAC